jgi:hypothetical protein
MSHPRRHSIPHDHVLVIQVAEAEALIASTEVGLSYDGLFASFSSASPRITPTELARQWTSACEQSTGRHTRAASDPAQHAAMG